MKPMKTLFALAIAASALFAGAAMAAAPKAQKCTGDSVGGIVKSVGIKGPYMVMTFTNNPEPLNVSLKEKEAAAALAKVKPGTLHCEKPDPLM